jgi:hypothetical protein
MEGVARELSGKRNGEDDRFETTGIEGGGWELKEWKRVESGGELG